MKLPPFLLGATIIFWGWHSGLWLAAIPLAILYEGSRYINWRWELITADFRNVSHVCTVLLVGVLIYLWFSDRSLRFIFSFFQWLPVICAPLLIAQAYSTSDRVDFHALLFFKEGKGDRRQLFLLDLTYPYFAICILAASAANVRDSFFYLGAVVLIGGAFVSLRSPRFSTGIFLCLLLLSTGLGTVGHTTMHNLQMALQHKTSRFFYRFYRPQTDPNQTSTAIGDIGSVKLSNQIVLRLKPTPGETPPQLIRQATYNKYASGFWVANNAEFTPVEAGAENSWILREKALPGKTVTISENLEEEPSLLKLPDGSFGIDRLSVEKIERNQYGTVQISVEPGLLSYQISYDPQLSETSPLEEDVRVPKIERPAIAQIVAELELNEKSPREILSSIKQFFDTEFDYSLKLALQRRNRTPLSAFLLDHRLGHCEYFATATTLLLREVGIPARYAVGYSVHEFSQWEGQYVVRGRHAHAWTQVYLDGQWQTFDPTPSAWIAIEDRAASNWQYLQDLMSLIWFKFARVTVFVRQIDLIYLWWLALPLGIIVVRQFTGNKHQRSIKALKLKEEIDVGTDSELYSIERELTQLGLGRDRSETWQEWLLRLEQAENLAAVTELYSILNLHYRYRFDPQGIDVRERAKLRSACIAWLERYRASNNDRC